MAVSQLESVADDPNVIEDCHVLYPRRVVVGDEMLRRQTYPIYRPSCGGSAFWGSRLIIPVKELISRATLGEPRRALIRYSTGCVLIDDDPARSLACARVIHSPVDDVPELDARLREAPLIAAPAFSFAEALFRSTFCRRD